MNKMHLVLFKQYVIIFIYDVKDTRCPLSIELFHNSTVM